MMRPCWILLLPCCLLPALAGSPFTVWTGPEPEIRCQGKTIARLGLPRDFGEIQWSAQTGGSLSQGDLHRLELATFEDRLEYTLEFRLEPPQKACVMQALVCHPVDDGLELRCVLPGKYPARFRAKFIF